MFQRFLFVVFCASYPFYAMADESIEIVQPVANLGHLRVEPPVFTSDQLATLGSASDLMIGNVINALSGNLCLRQTDFTVSAAHPIPLERVYIAPFMPVTFFKDWDKDCYYRRVYLLHNYDGWNFFPHLSLWFSPDTEEVHLIDPSGAAYDFSVADTKTSMLYPFAVSNLGPDEKPSGRFDPRNTRIICSDDKVTVFSPDGSLRHYRHKDDTVFLLEKEIMPNGKVYKYHYSDYGRFASIESCDPKEQFIYASINIVGAPSKGQCSLVSSTGQSASYTFESRRVSGKFAGTRNRLKYSGILPPLLVAVSSPQYRYETATYNDPQCLLQSFSGKDQTFTVNYAPFGEGNREHFCITHLLRPVGKDDAFVPVYEMAYELPIEGWKEGKTIVKNCCDRTTTVYHFSTNLLPLSIQYFDEEGGLKKEKIYSWNNKNWLAAVELRDGDKNILHRTSYEYDFFGNPIEETFTGDLTGNNKIESRTIRREFSQDGRNLLLKEETEEGKVTAFEYLPETNLITSKVATDGDQILFREVNQYDDFNNLVKQCIEDGKAHKTIVEYTLRQEPPFLHLPQLIEEKYADNGQEKLLKSRELVYNELGKVIEEKIYDSHGEYAYSICKEYNERGDILRESNPLGQKRSFVYDEKGHCIDVTNFSQRLNDKKNYDVNGRLRLHSLAGDEVDHTTLYTYAPNGDLIQKLDPFGNLFSYENDPLTHKVTKTHSPSIVSLDGKEVSVCTASTYDVFGREISKTDENGSTTHTRYNAYGSPTEIVYPDESKEQWHYAPNGEVASHTDRDGLTTHYSYDVLGRLISKKYGDNQGEERYLYDGLHLAEEQDCEGNKTSYFYDGAGRKVLEEKCGRTASYAYDPLGRIEAIQKGKIQTLFARDLEGRVLEEKKFNDEGSLLHQIKYAYDDDGKLSQVSRCINGMPAVESFLYDAFGRQIEHQDPYNNKTFTLYNENLSNNLGQRVLQITRIDALGTKTVEIFDPYGHVVKKETLNSQGDILACQERRYDPCGCLTCLREHRYLDTNDQKTISTGFTYTKNHQLESETRAVGSSEARTTIYTYTPGGKVSSKKFPDETVLTYAYTPSGWLCGVDSSDGKVRQKFEYNKKGELIFASNGKNEIKREVDPFGNVTHEIFPNHISIQREYDDLDRVVKLVISDLGHISYEYDPLFLKKVSRFTKEGKLQYAHQYEYDQGGNLLGENMIMNLGQINHTIDLKGREVSIESPYLSQVCVWDGCDNLIQSTLDNESTPYSYDCHCQLTAENDERYSYDSLCNRTNQEVNDLNEVLSLTYDLKGNQMGKGENVYAYDALNRLTEVTMPDKKKVRFTYDPLGRRLSKIMLDKYGKETERQNFLYDREHEIGSLTLEGTLKTLKVPGRVQNNGQPAPIAVEMNKRTYAPVVDMQGNICKLYDTYSKKISHRYAYSAFGVEKEKQKDDNPWRYAATRFDPETNLIYFGERYYDPELGRWLTPDLAGCRNGSNLYHFFFNNPYRLKR